MAMTCNIEKDERTSRIVLGAILVIGAILGFSRFFAVLLGLVLVVEGLLGWCAILAIKDKFFGNGKSDGGSPPSNV